MIIIIIIIVTVTHILGRIFGSDTYHSNMLIDAKNSFVGILYSHSLRFCLFYPLHSNKRYKALFTKLNNMNLKKIYFSN